RSRSASASTTIGFLPPISSWVRVKLSAAARAIRRPTSVEPVKVTARTSGCATSASDRSAPDPVTNCSAPGGRPASSRMWTTISPTAGVWLAGLSTAALPAIRAGPSLRNGTLNGKFHGHAVKAPAADDDEQQEEDDVGDRHDRRGPDHRSARPDHGCAHPVSGRELSAHWPNGRRFSTSATRMQTTDQRKAWACAVPRAPKPSTRVL